MIINRQSLQETEKKITDQENPLSKRVCSMGFGYSGVHLIQRIYGNNIKFFRLLDIQG